jgi:hypothetical protein
MQSILSLSLSLTAAVQGRDETESESWRRQKNMRVILSTWQRSKHLCVGFLGLVSSNAFSKTPNFLLSVLLLLDLLSGSLSALLQSRASKTIAGLEFHGILNGVIDESEASGLSSTELASEPKGEDGVLVLDFVHLSQSISTGISSRVNSDLGQLLLELRLGDICATGVDDVDHLRMRGEDDEKENREVSHLTNWRLLKRALRRNFLVLICTGNFSPAMF